MQEKSLKSAAKDPNTDKNAILRIGWRREDLSLWIGWIQGGILVAMTETHNQSEIRHNRCQDHLKAGFGFPEISALTDSQSHQAGNPMFNDNAFA